MRHHAYIATKTLILKDMILTIHKPKMYNFSIITITLIDSHPQLKNVWWKTSTIISKTRRYCWFCFLSTCRKLMSTKYQWKSWSRERRFRGPWSGGSLEGFKRAESPAKILVHSGDSAPPQFVLYESCFSKYIGPASNV